MPAPMHCHSIKALADISRCMFKLTRLLSIWLIVSILGYGMALAGGRHAEPADHSGHVHALGAGTDNADHTQAPNDPDHCCHGISHLLGFTTEMAAAEQPASPHHASARSPAFYSTISLPDLHPPIAA